MDTPQGWSRARLKLQGLDLEYKSLKEAYYQSALEKQKSIEAFRDMALFKSAANQDADDINEAVNKYMEEKFPGINEGRGDFMERGTEILEQEAGKVFTIGGGNSE